MVFLADHLGWLVVCGLLLHFFVFPVWGGPRRSAVLESGRSAARPDSGTAAVSVADGCLPAEQSTVPDFWKAVA